MPEELQTIPDLTSDIVRRIVTYTDEITYFGENSAGLAIATAAAQQTALHGESRYRALLRRHTLLGAQGDALVEVAEESGVTQLGPAYAAALVIVQPWKAEVTAITDARIEVPATDPARAAFEVGDSVRVVEFVAGSAATVRTEVATILEITEGTGPNGGDEFDLGFLAQFTGPSADDNRLRVLLRKTLTAGTVFKSSSGIRYTSLEDVTVGDSNPALEGESSALALADKVWVEATDPGAAGNVEALTIDTLETPDEKIRALFNPNRAEGGDDVESDFALKYRTAHQGQLAAVETQAAVEALARGGNSTVLRAFIEDSSSISTIRFRVMTRNAAGLSINARDGLAAFIRARVRSEVEVLNVVATAVEVEATITLDPGPGTPFERVLVAWRSAATLLSTFLDWRKWPPEQPVEEADLLAIVRSAEGVSGVVTSTFLPAEDVAVAAASVPRLVRLRLVDQTSGESFGVALDQTF